MYIVYVCIYYMYMVMLMYIYVLPPSHIKRLTFPLGVSQNECDLRKSYHFLSVFSLIIFSY